MLNNVTINAGQTLEYFEPGDFFRIMEASDPLDITFYRKGAEVARAESVSEGYAEKFRGEGFDRYRITSATTQLVQIVARNGTDVAYDRPPVGQITGVVGLDAPTLAALETTNAVVSGVVALDAPTLAALENVSVQNVNGAFAQSQVTVTTTSANIAAENAGRRYLLVQNNDTNGIVFVNLSGVAATAANGVKLAPGASLELDTYCPTQSISAIGSIGSNANVVVVEG